MTEALLEAFRSNTSRYAGGGGFDLAQIQRLQLQPVDLDLNNDNIHTIASGGSNKNGMDGGKTVKSLGLTAKAPEAPVQQAGETANLEFSVIVDRVVQEIQNLPGYSLHEKQNFMSDFYENVWVPYHRRRRNRTLRKSGITTDDLLKRALQIRRDLVLHYRKKEDHMNRNAVFDPEQNATRMENALRVDLRRRMRLDRLVQDITDAHKNGLGLDQEELAARKRKEEEEKGFHGTLESALDELIPIDADGNFTQVSDQKLHQSRGRRHSRQLHVPQPEDVYGPLSARGRRRSIAEAFSRGGSPVDGEGSWDHVHGMPPSLSRRSSRASSYQGSDTDGSDLYQGAANQHHKSSGATASGVTGGQATLSPNTARHNNKMLAIGENTASTNTQLNLGLQQPITIAIGGPDGPGTRPLKESRDQRRARLGIGAPQSARDHAEGQHGRAADFTAREHPKTARGDLERGSMGRDRSGYYSRGKGYGHHRGRKPKLSAVGEIAKEASQLLHDLAAKAKKRVLGLEPFTAEDARVMHDRLKGTKSPFSDTIRSYLSSAVASPDGSKDAFAQEILDPRMQLHTKNVTREAEEMEARDPGSLGADFAPFDKDPLLSARVTARVLPRRDRDESANMGSHLHRYLPSATEVTKDVLDNHPVPQAVQDLATSAIEDDLEGGVPKLTFYPRFQTLEGFGKLMLRSAGSRLSSRRPEDISLQSQSRPVGALNDQNVAFNGGVIDMDDHLLRMGVGSGRAQDRNLVQLFTELFDQDTAYMMHDQGVQEYIDKRGDRRKMNVNVDVGGDGAGDQGSPRTPRTPRGTATGRQKSKSGVDDDDDDEDANLAKRQIKKLVELRNEVKNEQHPIHEGEEGSTDGPDLLGSNTALDKQPLFSHLTPSRLTANQDGALTKLRHRGVTDGNDLRFEETISGAKVDSTSSTPAEAVPSKPRFDFDIFGSIVDESQSMDMRLEALSDDEEIEVTENFQSVVAASRGTIPRSSSYTDMTTFLQGKDQIITTETPADASSKDKLADAQHGEVLTASSVPYNYEDEVKKANKVVATRQARLADNSGQLGLGDTHEDSSNILTEDQAEEVMQAELQKMLAGDDEGGSGKPPLPLSRKTGASTTSSKNIARTSQQDEKALGEQGTGAMDSRPQSSGKGVTFAGVDEFAAAREAGEPVAVHRRRSPTPPEGVHRGGDPLAEAPTTVVKRAFVPKRFPDYVSEFDKMEEAGSDASRTASAGPSVARPMTSEEELHTIPSTFVLPESDGDAGASSRPDSMVYDSRMSTPGAATDSLAGDPFSRPSTRPSSIAAADYDGSRQVSPMSEYFMHPLTPSTQGSRSLATTPVLQGTGFARPSSTQMAARSALLQVRATQHDFVTLNDAERVSSLPHRNSRASYQATANDGADPSVDRRVDSPLVIYPIRGQPAPPSTPPRTPLSRRPASRPSRQGTPGGKPPTTSSGSRSTFVPRFATKDQPTNVEGADGDGDRKDFVPLQSKHQQLLERLWNTSRMPVYQKVDMMVKYTTESYAKKIDAALQQWDLCIKLAQDRERALEALQDFEWIASDPRRYFTESSVNRLVEAKERARLTAVLNKLTPRCKKAILELKKNFGDNFTFDGRPYLDKMRTDQVELLYDVSSARTEDEIMHGMTARDPPPPKSEGGYLRPTTASSAAYGNTLAIGAPPPSPSQHAPRPPAGPHKSTRRQRRRKHKEKKKASTALYSSLQEASRVQTKWEGIVPP